MGSGSFHIQRGGIVAEASSFREPKISYGQSLCIYLIVI